MVTFFRSSRVWVTDFLYEGRPRRWLKALPEGTDARQAMQSELESLYGPRARLVAVRPATPEEDRDYLRGDLPRNAYCPSGKVPRTEPRAPGKGPGSD